jgi:hypothetical protein
MKRKTRVSAWLLVMGVLTLGLTLGMTCKKKNQPPNTPSIPSGPSSGRKGDSLHFSTVADDPDGDSIAVRFDWGDGAMSDWSKLVPNGDPVVGTHAWQSLGTYSIRAQARDTKETASAWSGEGQLTILASFTVTFGGSGDDMGYSVLQTSDGDYVVVGTTHSFGAGAGDVWLIKTDASGNKVWDKTFGGTSDDEGHSVQRTSDGGYVITSWTDSYGVAGDDVWLIKTDACGNKVWDKTFGGSGEDWCSSVKQTSDGGYIITGHTDTTSRSGPGVWLIKTDTSGNEVWDKTFGGMGWGIGRSVLQTPDGGYIIAGETDAYGAGAEDVWLIKTDSLGNKVWDKTYGGIGNDMGYSVQRTSDGGYIIAGWTENYGAGYVDIWLIKTDASGNPAWDKTYGGSAWDEGYSVQQTSDGGYVIAGVTQSFGAGRHDVWLIKTDAEGN